MIHTHKHTRRGGLHYVKTFDDNEGLLKLKNQEAKAALFRKYRHKYYTVYRYISERLQ